MQPPRVIELGRGPTLEGTRFTVFDIIPLLQKGRHVDYISAVYDLTREEVQALLRYIEEHQETVMAANAAIEARIARGNSPEIEEKRKGSRANLERIREELRRKKATEANGARDPH